MESKICDLGKAAQPETTDKLFSAIELVKAKLELVTALKNSRLKEEKDYTISVYDNEPPLGKKFFVQFTHLIDESLNDETLPSKINDISVEYRYHIKKSIN